MRQSSNNLVREVLRKEGRRGRGKKSELRGQGQEQLRSANLKGKDDE
jgi:hypothetical protein